MHESRARSVRRRAGTMQGRRLRVCEDAATPGWVWEGTGRWWLVRPARTARARAIGVRGTVYAAGDMLVVGAWARY